jgi:hypothetical protein
MRGTRVGMSFLVAALLSGSGCQTTPNTTIKPPLHEEYTLPPTDDSRFSAPPAYPKEALDNSQFKKQNKPGEQFQGPGGRMGAGPTSMGGY